MPLFSLRSLSRISLEKQKKLFSKVLIPSTKCFYETDSAEVLSRKNSLKVKEKNSLFKKFENIIQEDHENSEKVYLTNYGSIRLDSDNSITQKDISSNSSQLNFIDDHYLNNLISVPYKSEIVNRDKNFVNEKPDETLDSTILQSENTEDLNYIDEYYFKNSLLNSNEKLESGLSESMQVNYFPEEIEPKELNYIDQQYFDENLVNNDEPMSDVNLKEKHIFAHNPNLDSNLSDDTTKLYDFSSSFDFDISSDIQNKKLDFLKQSTKKPTEDVKFIYAPKAKKIIKNDLVEDEKLDVDIDQEAPSNSEKLDSSSTSRAIHYAQNLRKKRNSDSEEVNSGKPKILKYIPRIHLILKHDMINIMKNSVVYNDNDILSINKIYGLPAHRGGSKRHKVPSIVELLPELAESLKISHLYPIHRLDDITTGVLLFAKTEERAEILKKQFHQKKIQKKYLAIVKGVPKNINGIIDIPIGEGNIGEIRRMVLRPDIDGFRGKAGTTKKAITKFKVLSANNSCSLLELMPMTGVKHQLRVHLSFGLGCAILGDHKYSFMTQIKPQKLPGDILEYLKIEQSKVRYLPTFLHARSLLVPLEDNRFAHIRAPLPKFFTATLKHLKLSSSRNMVDEKVLEIIQEDI